jgi:hypothetical protein
VPTKRRRRFRTAHYKANYIVSYLLLLKYNQIFTLYLDVRKNLKDCVVAYTDDVSKKNV